MLTLAALVPALLATSSAQDGVDGYYRYPSLRGHTVVFTAEGDLWKVGDTGGPAQRLTTHPDMERSASISPDGKWVAFKAAYEGASEVYVMPISGGLPERMTYEGGPADVRGWSPDNRILYLTRNYSTLPNPQLGLIDPRTHKFELLPLSQAADGSFSPDRRHLFFTRFAFQGSYTKRYHGGTAQNIWRWDGGDQEAVPLTKDFKGTSRNPMFWHGRVYFESDRDGVMNIWSMDENGKNLKQHTRHNDFDVAGAQLDNGRIIYQCGADLWILDIESAKDTKLNISLTTDLDQSRERWIKEPFKWVSSAHISADGSKVVLTARGEVFVAPTKSGRIVTATRTKSVRYRNAIFMPDGKSLVSFSDESGEVELWKLDGAGAENVSAQQLTNDSTILRWIAKPSPDGRWIAHSDKNHRLFLLDTVSKTNKLIAEAQRDDILDFSWSPDSKMIAFVQTAENTFDQIRVYSLDTGKVYDATTDRYNNESPAFSADSRMLFFFSDRNLHTIVSSPWGARAPEPYYNNMDELYFVPLAPGMRSPFKPDDEISSAAKPSESRPEINFEGLASRIQRVPLAPGNYSRLQIGPDRLFYISASTSGRQLMTLPIRNKSLEPASVMPAVVDFELSQDSKKLMARTSTGIFVFDATGAPANLSDAKVPLEDWTFSFLPLEEWRQMFKEAWRLHRDYFYATNMHGVDWPGMLKKYLPLVDRVTDRAELSDLLAQMVGELSVLHTYVGGGDMRQGSDQVSVASIGAEWARDDAAGGYRITKLYQHDPDLPDTASPLVKQEQPAKVGDIVAAIDGTPTLTVPDAASLLRSKDGQQVRLKIKRGETSFDMIITALSQAAARNLRYDDWEQTRAQKVNQATHGDIGYVHLRAMGSNDFDRWAREFYPQFQKSGLIIDVRHNSGGNIDSWVLEKLVRKAWTYWNNHGGFNDTNMQYAFRGHMVVLCDENTASDGEAFTEGFKRLGLGKVIGTRTWGGEVWLTSSNSLVDGGIATAAEFGVFGPEGEWLIEGHGVDPDIEIDNLPFATYNGSDAQLDTAIKYLQAEISKKPVKLPPIPPLPDKSRKGGGG